MLYPTRELEKTLCILYQFKIRVSMTETLTVSWFFFYLNKVIMGIQGSPENLDESPLRHGKIYFPNIEKLMTVIINLSIMCVLYQLVIKFEVNS